ncbi:hypothetical protein FKM82_024000 [Ascaphus truei]
MQQEIQNGRHRKPEVITMQRQRHRRHLGGGRPIRSRLKTQRPRRRKETAISRDGTVTMQAPESWRRHKHRSTQDSGTKGLNKKGSTHTKGRHGR